MHHPLRFAVAFALPMALGGCVTQVRPHTAVQPPAPLSLDDPWPAPLEVPLPEDAGLLTRRLLAAARAGDGRTIVYALHPTLAEVWRRRGAARGLSTASYAAFFCRGFNDLGRVTEIETKRGQLRAEVEVQFARKHRDVDFKFRRHGGRWTLHAIDDYP